METLTDVVKDLVLHHRVTHTQILTHIRNVLGDLGKDLPKTQILYNRQYGGFGFSAAFIEFLQDKKVTSDEYDFEARMEYVPFIKPFGEFTLSKYRMFRRMIMLCRYYDIDTMVSCAREVYVSKKLVADNEERRASLKRYLDNIYHHGDKDRVNDQSLFDILDTRYPILSGYIKQSYEHFISEADQRIEKYTVQQASIKAKFLEKYPKLQWSALYANLEQMIHQMCKEKDDDDTRYKNNSCLADMLRDGREQDPMIWYGFGNKTLCEYAMRYMIIMHQDYEQPMREEPSTYDVYDFLISHNVVKIPTDMYDKIVYDVGLLCASSRHCSLAIGEVPQYFEWEISEYDGRERKTYYN